MKDLHTSQLDPLIAELAQETEATYRLLQAVPADKLDWRPHAKSMTLGELALHIAALPAVVEKMSRADTIPAPDFSNLPSPESKEKLLETMDASVAAAMARMKELTDEQCESTLRVMKGEDEVFSVPKGALFRGILLNHLYHHRGQLTVYLRLLDVDLPVTYGASHDENPFA